MCTQPSPKTIACRDCGYKITISALRDDEVRFLFCERCGCQSYDIVDFNKSTRRHTVQFLKELLHTKIF